MINYVELVLGIFSIISSVYLGTRHMLKNRVLSYRIDEITPKLRKDINFIIFSIITIWLILVASHHSFIITYIPMIFIALVATLIIIALVAIKMKHIIIKSELILIILMSACSVLIALSCYLISLGVEIKDVLSNEYIEVIIDSNWDNKSYYEIKENKLIEADSKTVDEYTEVNGDLYRLIYRDATNNSKLIYHVDRDKMVLDILRNRNFTSTYYLIIFACLLFITSMFSTIVIIGIFRDLRSVFSLKSEELEFTVEFEVSSNQLLSEEQIKLIHDILFDGDMITFILEDEKSKSEIVYMKSQITSYGYKYTKESKEDRERKKIKKAEDRERKKIKKEKDKKE